MERQFRLNWSAVVEEARQRRKAQKLTQQRLALLAEVSAPTISRFEGGEKDIQLSSVLRILGQLGMLDERRLEFPQAQERYNSEREIVAFWGKDGAKEVRCAISQEALEDHYKGGHRDPLKTYLANRAAIQQEARRKYLAEQIDSDGSIVIRSEDL